MESSRPPLQLWHHLLRLQIVGSAEKRGEDCTQQGVRPIRIDAVSAAAVAAAVAVAVAVVAHAAHHVQVHFDFPFLVSFSSIQTINYKYKYNETGKTKTGERWWRWLKWVKWRYWCEKAEVPLLLLK